MRKILLILSLLIFSFQITAQQSFHQSQNLTVTKEGAVLTNPWAGGANVPQISPIDLNNDGILDLIIFDKNGDQVNCFLNNGTQNTVDYHYAPEYNTSFPEINGWILLRDYNCDSKMDIFTSHNGGIRLYENTSLEGDLSFELIGTILTDRGSGPTNLYVSSVDIPHIGDLDYDGDLDVLTFTVVGSHVEWHKNYAVETYGTCDSIDFQLEDDCWGDFSENFSDNSVTLYDCDTKSNKTNSAKHSGSTVTALDLNGDSYFELLLGDITFDNIVKLENSASTENALMTSQDTNFPSYNQSISIPKFPAAYHLDVNNDAKKDLIITPNGNNVSQNYDNIWFYQNESNTDEVTLNLSQKNFLTDEMIEVGSGAHPVFFDYNNDSLMDLIVANYGYYIVGGNFNSQLALFKNVGTTTEPAFEWVTDDYASLGALNFANNIIPTFGDIDNDGDKDMIVGDADGKLHMLINIEMNGEANFYMNSVNYFDIDVGSFASPTLVDLDRDNDLDLVIGSRQGFIKYYENQGSNSAADFILANDTLGAINLIDPIYNTAYTTPVFIDGENGYELFIGTERGKIHHYNNIDNNTLGTYTLVEDSVTLYSQSIKTAPALYDINGDNFNDMLIGVYTGGIHLLYGSSLNDFQTEELKANRLQVQPNPTSGTLTVESEVAITLIEVYNLNGQKVLTKEASNTININSLPNGVYLLKMSDANQNLSYEKITLLK